MIRIALPSKGRLSEHAVALLQDCGYRVDRRDRGLTATDPDADIEWFFLRPKDIPNYVASGSLAAGITGRDLVAEAGTGELVCALDLEFGSSRLCVAVADDSSVASIADVRGMRVATSFPKLTARALDGADCRIITLEGSVEIAIALGTADAIVDLVSSGATLRRTGLRVVGEPIVESTAALYVHPSFADDKTLAGIVRRLQGRIVAHNYVLIEYDVPSGVLAAACELTPGIESPTVSALHKDGWHAVRAMTPAVDAHVVMDRLADLGCRGVIMTRIESSRM